MRGKFDLHLHTTASDGMLEPEEVVRQAAKAGLLCIAVTDHDTGLGVGRAREEGAKLRLPVIGGMELTAQYPGELHILGYGMDLDSPAWQAFSVEQRRRRAERNTLMLDRLEALGLDLSEEYRPWNVRGEYGRMHMALGLKEAGHAASVQQAFDRFLRVGAPAYVKRRKFSPQEIISAIKQAGGLAVLAHPGRMDAEPRQVERLVLELKGLGLEGLEAFYPTHEPAEAEFYRKLAEREGLLCTYGSDWHGMDDSGLAQGFENFTIPDGTYAWLDAMAKKSGGNP